MALRRSIAGTVIRIFVASLAVGMVLSVLNITPQGLLQGIGGTAEDIFEVGVTAINWAVPFVLVGAVVVIPLWLLRLIWRTVRKPKT